jgi:DeoR family ulaG and ulaABCDEF operon transcriptional repressor
MHAAEREKLILEALSSSGFITYRELEILLSASPASIRRDLKRLSDAGQIERVHGGAKSITPAPHRQVGLMGTPFELSITQNLGAKKLIGRAAANLCEHGEGIMIDGGTTTLQMCPHLAGKTLQVLTNSLHIVNGLIEHEDVEILLPSGTLFRDQNIILAPAGEESMPRFHAPKLFMGAAAVGHHGVMQQDVVLVAAERRLIERADQVILLVDSSKFKSSSGSIVCGLETIDIVVTEAEPPAEMVAALEKAEVRLIVVGQS